MSKVKVVFMNSKSWLFPLLYFELERQALNSRKMKKKFIYLLFVEKDFFKGFIDFNIND